nr:tetratricopeptide repeat protein [Pseudonocardia sp. C8]
MGHARQRHVLAALLVDADRPVSTEQIVDRVWGEHAAPRSRDTVYSYLSRLRRTLAGAGVELHRRPGGHVVAVDRSAVDLHRFRDLVTRARATADAERASSLFEQALGLWRGEAFAGLDGEWVQRLREGLEQERYSAELDGNDLRLRRGDHAALLPVLTARAAAHPLDERLAGQLMLALFRCGRQADALSQFQEIRSRLVEELGLEPDAALQQLHQEILGGGPAADDRGPPAPTGPAVPAQLPAEVPGFTGRAGDLAELDRQLSGPDPAAGPGTTVRISVISGTAGVGKTALALRWAHRSRDGFPDGQLYVNLRGYDPDEPLSATEALTRLVRALSMPGAQVPTEPEELSATYRGLIGGRRVLVVLDNASSAEQVRPLLPGTASAAVVVTSRDSLAGLVARDGARRLLLDRLPVAEAVGLLESLIGDRATAEAGAAATLAHRCARLPLALRVAAELVAGRPAAPLATLVAELADEQRRLELLDAAGDARTAVRAVFSWSYRQLPDDSARAFRVLGLHPGPDLDSYAAAALTGTGLDRARDLVAGLARGHLIREVAPDRYEMHDLLRAYAVQRSSAVDTEQDRRDALTRLFDFYMHAAGCAMDALAPAETALRPRVGPATTPVPPIDDPGTGRAWLDAERACLTAVCVHAAVHGWPAHATDLAGTVARYFELGGHYLEAVAVHTHARDAAQRTGDRAAEGRALDNLGLVHRWQGRYPDAAEEHRRAVVLSAEAGDRIGEAYALGNVGLVAWQQGDYTQAAEYQLRALALFREIGDRVGEARTVTCLGFVRRRQGRYREAAEHHRSALALFEDLCDPIGESYTHASLGLALSRMGHDDEAVEHHRHSLVLFRENGDRAGEAYALGNLGLVDCQRGDLAQAIAHHQQALAVGREIGDRATEAYSLDDLGVVYRRQGRTALAVRHHQQALARCRDIGELPGEAKALNNLGETRYAAGEPAGARHEHAAALTLATRIGDRYEQARAHDGVARCLRDAGDPEQARGHWREALDLYTDLEVPEAAGVRAELSGLERPT